MLGSTDTDGEQGLLGAVAGKPREDLEAPRKFAVRGSAKADTHAGMT
jgi:hypothetical protein